MSSGRLSPSKSVLQLLVAGSTAAVTACSPADVRIVLGYEGMGRYVAAAQASPEPDLAALFQEHVVEPIWEACAAGAELESYVAPMLSQPIVDLDGLDRAVDALTESDTRAVVEEAVERAARALPGPATTVCVFAVDPLWTWIRDDMSGVSGVTPGAGRVWIQIYPEGDWQVEIGPAVAHEYHHSVRMALMQEPIAETNLIGGMVLEGMADSFVRVLYPDRALDPWTDALTPEQETAAWEVMQPYLETTGIDTVDSFLFGSRDDVPRWAGYTIGFHIVQAFLQRNPEASVASWTPLDSREILTRSGYSGER